MKKIPLSKYLIKHKCKEGLCCSRLSDGLERHRDTYELPSDVFIYVTLLIEEMVGNKDSLPPH
tara:strand:- start:767 stop:955 length:189 start_codon:yes stop_codon:yes gene_type:complete